MRDWLALRGLLAVLVLWGALLGLIAAQIALGGNHVVIPPPEQSAVDLLQALKAHRFEGAWMELSEPAGARTAASDLQDLTRRLEEKGVWIVSLEGSERSRSGDQALVDVDLDLPSGSTGITLPMRREQGEWKVDSIEPLAALLASP